MTWTVFQIIVVGALVLAWVWVLGRPLLAKVTYLSRRMRSDDGGIDYIAPTAGSLFSAFTLPFTAPFRWWGSQSVYARRRQMFLALLVTAIGWGVAAYLLRGWFFLGVGVSGLALFTYASLAIRVGAEEVKARRGVQRRLALRREKLDRIPGAVDLGRPEFRRIDKVQNGSIDLAVELGREFDTDATDPTLTVGDSKRRSRRLVDASKRIIFRRPGSKAPGASSPSPAIETSSPPLKRAANDR